MKSENWMKWDLDSRTGWRMAGFFGEFGALGYGVFLVMVEHLYRATENKMPSDAKSCKCYANLCKLEQNQFELIIDSCVQYGLLERDENYIWSPRVMEEVVLRNQKSNGVSQKRQLAANTRWNREKRVETPMQTDANSMQIDANDARLDKSRGDISILGMSSDENPPLKKKKSRGDKYRTFNQEDFKFPHLWGNQARAAVEKWVNYKEQQGTAKMLVSYQEEVNLYAERPKEFVELVTRAISNSWQGLNAQIPIQQQERKSQVTVNQESSLNAVKNILKRQGYEA